jgi:hypothetical protein
METGISLGGALPSCHDPIASCYPERQKKAAVSKKFAGEGAFLNADKNHH